MAPAPDNAVARQHPNCDCAANAQHPLSRLSVTTLSGAPRTRCPSLRRLNGGAARDSCRLRGSNRLLLHSAGRVAHPPDARRFYRKVAEKEGGLVEAVQPVPGPHRGILGPYGSPRARRRRTCHSSLAVGPPSCTPHPTPPPPTQQQLALAWQSAPAEPSVLAWVGLAGARPPPQAVGSPSGHRAAQRSSVVLGAGRREHGVRRWVGWGEALPAAGAW